MPTKDRGGLKHPAGGDGPPGSEEPWIVPDEDPAGEGAQDEGVGEGEAPPGDDS